MHLTIPLGKFEDQDAPKVAFCVSGGEKRVPEPPGFDGFAKSESGQSNGWLLCPEKIQTASVWRQSVKGGAYEGASQSCGDRHHVTASAI